MPGPHPDTRVTQRFDHWYVENDLTERQGRQLIADGKIQTVRLGPKTLLVVLDSWRALVAQMVAEGVPEYDGVRGAHQANRRAKGAELADAPAP